MSFSPKLPLGSAVRLFLIRHGESEFNLAPHLIGGQSLEAKLTTAGRFQSRRLGVRLAMEGIEFDELFSSHAIRAVETAKISMSNWSKVRLANDFSAEFPSILIRESLVEQSQGSWEGQSRSMIYTPEVIESMAVENIRFRAPEGESLKDVQIRAMEFLGPKLVEAAGKSKELKRDWRIGIFCHGGTIRTLLQFFLGIDERWTWLLHEDNTAINEILLDHRGLAAIRINDAAHWKMKFDPIVMQNMENQWKSEEEINSAKNQIADDSNEKKSQN